MSQKRNLPSWISSRDPPHPHPQPESKKKPKDDADDEHNIRNAPQSSSTTMDFSKLLVCENCLHFFSCHCDLSFF